MAIRITIRGAEETVKQLRRFPERLRLALIKAMEDATILIRDIAKVNAPVARGHLRTTLVQAVTERDNRIEGHVGSGLVYAPILEFGRAAGWFPPPRELAIWARRSPKFSVRDGDWNAGFILARAIKRRGFRAQPYLLPALKDAAPRVSLIFQTALSNAAQAEGGQA